MFAVLIPVYNDGESLAVLIAKLDTFLKEHSYILDVIIVNDGGTDCAPYIQPPQNIRQIQEIKLAVNMGHQRAIAVGLTELMVGDQYEAVVIMDGDGEDKPEDVFRLLEYHARQPEPVIVASRATRSENIRFRLFYRIYKFFFLILTGKRIDFGNFMLLPAHVVSKLVYRVDFWNHLAATILHSKTSLRRIKTSRGERYKGMSRMNFEGLVTHGLSAISVFLIPIFTRVLISLTSALGFAILAIVVVAGIRFFTDLAIPGWATNLTGILLILILQLILVILISAFAALNQRASLTSIPLLNIRDYIKENKIIFQRSS